MSIRKKLDSFFNRFTGFGTSIDRALASEIAPPELLDDDRLEDLHRSNAYAGIAVDELVYDATRKGWNVRSEEETDLCGEWDDQCGVVDKVNEAGTLARLLGGAAIFLIVDDGKPLTEELTLDKPFKILNLVVLDKREMSPEAWSADLKSKYFGEVELWRIAPFAGASVEGVDEVDNVVHASRLVYFPGVRVSRRVRIENNGFDDSVLRRAMDGIRNKTTINQARANLIQDFKTDVVHVKNAEAIETGDRADYFNKKMQFMAKCRSILGITLLDEGETYTKSSTSVAGVADLDTNAVEELTTSFRMPRTKLSGDAPGGLNTDGESQQKNWNSQAGTYQQRTLKHRLRRIYAVALHASNGPTGGQVPESWRIEFNPLDEPTEKQQAEYRKLVADTDAIYLTNQVLRPDEVRSSRFTPQGYSPDTTIAHEEE